MNLFDSFIIMFISVPYKREAYVFVATDDKYAERALVPAYSLKEVQTSKPIVLLCTQGVASVSRFRNLGIFDEVVIRPALEIPQDAPKPKSSWCNVPRRRLPYTYNMAYSTFKIYRSAHDRYKDQVKVIHFLGTLERKPWNFNLNKTTHKLEPDADMYVKKWWQIYLKYVKRQQERHFQ
ncbi:hypothetical protein ACROYT_G004654 [Oculina patagonica]